MSDKEIVVVFGSEAHRRRYIKEKSLDPFNVVSAVYPHILGVMQVAEEVSIRVIRYPESSWAYIRDSFDKQIVDTEQRLESYRQQGIYVLESL